MWIDQMETGDVLNLLREAAFSLVRSKWTFQVFCPENWGDISEAAGEFYDPNTPRDWKICFKGFP